MEKLRSRKLWVATISAVALWVSAVAGVELDIEEMMAVLLPVVAYILGQSWADSQK